jgi:hypothetical protein
MNSIFQKITKNEHFFSQNPQKILKKKSNFFQKTLKKIQNILKKGSKTTKKAPKTSKNAQKHPNFTYKKRTQSPV